jgi:inner membrane protein
MCGIAFKLYVDSAVEQDLHERGITAKKYFTTPTPLNNMLWYVVAEGDGGHYTGYRSVFDRTGTGFRYAYRNDSLLNGEANSDDLNKLLRFSQGYYTAEMWHDTLVFNDLRFGEMLGWGGPQPRFVFHYFLKPPQENKLIVQRGRFAGWNKAIFLSFLRRIKGV